MDPSTLADATVAILSPYLAKFGEKAADKLGEEAPELGGKLLGWLRQKLGARGQGAMDDLVKKPDSEVDQTDLRTQLTKALQADPTLAAELAKLLPHDTTETGAMTLSAGAGAKAIQFKGSHNTGTIS
jgi:hypothetical protein